MKISLFKIIFATAWGILPSLVWLFYFLKKDPKPEPKKTIALCFFYGMLATLPAIYFEGVFSFYLNTYLKEIASVLSLIAVFFIFAFIEEFFKFLSAKISISRKKEFDEPIDPMIYLITSAMGFALVENLMYLYSGFFLEKNYGVEKIIIIAFERLLGPTFLHASASGFLGYFWAQSILKLKKEFLYFGILLASFLHMVFNFNIEVLGSEWFRLKFVILFIFLVSFPLSLAFKDLKNKEKS